MIDACHVGDVRDGLRAYIAAGIRAQTCVTSPPYWGLRDYGMPGQLGLESTPAEYVANMVEVFRLVRDVLADDGTLWLNIGDSYAAQRGGTTPPAETLAGGINGHGDDDATRGRKDGYNPSRNATAFGLKHKDLVGIPWRLAFALQADGWYLRSDIIWAKPNPMPESVTDRPTKAHEYVFLLAKGQRKSRVIQFADLSGERVHFGKYLGPRASDSWASQVCALLATSIFNRAQFQEDFGLPPFYAQEWKERADGGDSDFVRGLPSHHVATVWAARLLDGDASAKQFLEQLNSVRFTLGYGGDLLIRGVAPEGLDAPAFDTDREGTVTVHHAGKVGKIEFSHGRIVASEPTTCTYYYDAAAIAEAASFAGSAGSIYDSGVPGQSGHSGLKRAEPYDTRNRRTVWNIATQPYAEAHFAVMPRALVEPCVLAGTSQRGHCPACGKGWERVTEREKRFDSGSGRSGNPINGKQSLGASDTNSTPDIRMGPVVSTVTLGWQPTCECNAGEPVPGVVLDPFLGSGTVAQVAQDLGRRWIGCELNGDYVKMQARRTAQQGLALGAA